MFVFLISPLSTKRVPLYKSNLSFELWKIVSSAIEFLWIIVKLLFSATPFLTNISPVNLSTSDVLLLIKFLRLVTSASILSSYCPLMTAVEVLSKVFWCFSDHAPDERITKAVIEQTIIVSIKGSNIETMPSSIGSSVFDDAWAIGEEPWPASLETVSYTHLTLPTNREV